MKTAVVTGATGAIGRSLINVCISSGYEVLAVVHRTSPRAIELKSIPHCHVLELDLPEYGKAYDELTKQNIVLENYTVFFHLAWMAPFGKERNNLDLQVGNIQASIDAVRFAKKLGCSTYVGTGSQAEYGNIGGMLSADTPAFPETGYGIAKLCSGQMTRLQCEQLGLRHIWCRVLSVYGPHDRDQTLISYAVIQMMNNLETEFSPCDQLWDYIYSDDAAKAILTAAEHGESGRTYMVGSGEIHPLKHYIQKIAQITGYTKEIGFGKRNYNENQVMHMQADITALKEIGFVPTTTFEDGIKMLIQSKSC